MRSSVLLAVVVLLAVPAGRAWGQAAQGRLPIDPEVTFGTLPNGLRYYVRANQRPEKRAELRLVVNAGSVLEADDQRGLAHFVEHMAFNGTKNFPKAELVSYLESIGMRFGADLNASTSFDETVYMLTVPTDTGTALERGIQILEDWAHGQTFDPQEIDKERGVVIEEWRLGQGANARMQDSIFPVLFRGSRYETRLPIGSLEVLRTFEPDALKRFYRDWYRPDLMAVVAVGDFDVARVEGYIREHFGRLTMPANPQKRVSYPVPDHAETLVATVNDPEATSTGVQVYYMQTATENGTIAAYRKSLVGRLYDSMLGGRLSEVAQQADPPFIGAGSTQGQLVRTKEAYVIGAGVPDGGIARGLEAVLTEAERVARHGFTSSELEREKADLLRYYETAFAERAKTNSALYADEYVRNFLQSEAIPGIAAEYTLVKELLPGISLTELNALAREWMPDSNRVIVATAPRKDGLTLPTSAELLGIFAAVEKKEIAPYADDVADAPLVAQPPTPGTVVSERKIPDLDVTEWTLSNGARVLLKPTDFKDDEVLFRAYSPGGTSLVPDSDIVSATLATTAVTTGGIGQMSAVQLQKELAGKAAGVNPYIGDLEEGLAGGASPKDIETMFQLVHLYFTSPRTDSTAFTSFRTRLLAAMENQSADPRSAFSDTLQVTLAQHAPRARPMNIDRIKAWDLGRSIAFYEDRFADASDFTFALVGNFEMATVRPLVERWLASLPATRRQETWKDTGIRPPKGVVVKEVRKGIEPKSETRIMFTGPFRYTQESRYALASLVSVLDIKLRDILREDMGGTYGVTVSQSSGKAPWERYTVTIGFGSAPDRLEELTKAVFAEIEKVQKEGVDAETVAKVQEIQRRSHETSLKQNGYWISQLIYGAQTGEDTSSFLTYPSLIDGLTAARIQEAARAYLHADNYVRVSLVPQANN